MRRLRNLVLLPLLIQAGIMLQTQSGRAQQIIWADVTLPPFHHIAEGDFRGGGITDQLIERMRGELADHTHERLIVPVNRLIALLRKGPNYCNPSMKWTSARAEFMHYSIPSVFVPANGVVMRRRTSLDLPEEAVSFNSLLNNPDLVIGVESKRAYGPGMDAPLAARRTRGPAPLDISDNNGFQRLLRLLDRRRIDLVPGSPMEFTFARQATDLGDGLVFRSVQETGAFGLSHVACSKTPEGRRIIDRINRVLMRIRPDDSFRAIFEAWLPPSELPGYRRAYAEKFQSSRNSGS